MVYLCLGENDGSLRQEWGDFYKSWVDLVTDLMLELRKQRIKTETESESSLGQVRDVLLDKSGNTLGKYLRRWKQV